MGTKLQKFLASPDNSTSVSLNDDKINDGDAIKLAAALKDKTNLTSLYLQNNQIGDAGAAAVADSLKDKTNLTSLYLENNQIGEAGAAALADSLKDKTNLTTLWLSHNQIGDAGAAAVADSLKDKTNLIQLCLDNNQIGDAGAAAVADSLKDKTNLKYLYLNNNQIGNAGAAAIGEALRDNTSLNYLHLQGNRIGDTGAAALAEALKDKTNLTQLYLGGNQIGNETSATLSSNFAKVNHFNIASQTPKNPNSQPCTKEEIALNNELFSVAFRNDISKINQWISNPDIDNNRVGSLGKSILWYAALCGKEEMVKLLLKSGVHFDNINDSKMLILDAAKIHPKIQNLIKTGILADQIYQDESLASNDINLTTNNAEGQVNRGVLIERLKTNLLKQSLKGKFDVDTYKKQLGEYLKDHIPDTLIQDIKLSVERLHNERFATLNKFHAAMKKILQKEIDCLDLLVREEQLTYLMVHSPETVEALNLLSAIMLTPEEKKLLNGVFARYNGLSDDIKEVIKTTYPTQKNAVDYLLASIDDSSIIDAHHHIPSERRKKKTKPDDTETIEKYDPEIGEVKVFGAEQGKSTIGNNADIKKLTELISEGNERINGIEEKGILLLGNTGAGKSTLAHLLAGISLKARMDEKSGDLVLEALEELEEIKIGHGKKSETTIPNKCKLPSAVIWDCPGFNDTNIVQDIANMFYIRKLFENNTSLKFILAVPESDLSIGAKGKNFIDTLKSFIDIFTDIDSIAPSISLVITHAPPHKKIKHINHTIKKILKDNDQVTPQIKKLVKKIPEKAVHIFHKPYKEGDYNAPDMFDNIAKSTEFIKADSKLGKIAVSGQAEIYSKELLSTSKYNFNQILDVVAHAITDSAASNIDDANNILLQKYNVVRELLPSSGKYALPQNDNSFTDVYFREIAELLELQKIFNTNKVESLDDSVELLQKALSILDKFAAQGKGKNQNDISKIIKEYSYVLKQQFNYIKFFSDLCKSKLPDHAECIRILKICQEKINDNLEYTVKTLKLADNMDSNYYIEALKYMDLYPDSLICQKFKAECHVKLGALAEQNNDKSLALKEYIAAIKFDKKIPEIYQKLGALFTAQKDYEKAIKCYHIVNNSYKVSECFDMWLSEDKENAVIMELRADYLASIGAFSDAIKYYSYAFGLSEKEEQKHNVISKKKYILENKVKLSEQLEYIINEQDYFNFDYVDTNFVSNLTGESTAIVE